MRLAFALSGAAGLIYQLAWMRRLERILGASAYASAVTLAAFMLGLGLGSLWATHRASQSLKPARVYAWLEISVALWALALPLILLGLDAFYLSMAAPIGQQDLLLRSLVAALAVLPPAMVLGATFPYMARAIRGQGSAALAYGLNTLGAAAGVLVAAFALLPFVGIRAAEYLAILLNLSAAGLAWRAIPGKEPVEKPIAGAGLGLSPWLGPLAFGSGFAAMLFEVAATRVFAGQLGASTHAFSVMLATFLLGMGLASLGVERLKGARDWRPLGARLLLGSAIAAAAFTLLAPELPYYVLHTAHGLSEALGTRLGIVTLTGALLCGAILLPFALLNGACLPLLLRQASQAKAQQQALGRLYAINTLGAVMGALLAGFVLLPGHGVLAAALLASVSSLALWMTLGRHRVWRAYLPVAVLFSALILWMPMPNLASMGQGAFFIWRLMEPGAKLSEVLRSERENNEILYARDGVLSTVMVARDKHRQEIFMSNNGKIEASSSVDMATQIQIGAGTVLAWRGSTHGKIQGGHATVVGLASGMSAGAMLMHPLQAFDLIEIEPAGIEAARYFDGINHRPLDDPRTRIILDDARHVARLSPGRWDMICSEPSNPWVAGVGALFTLEAFEIWRDSLKSNGVLGQWLQAYEMDERDFKSVLRTMAEAFDYLAVLQIDDHGLGSYDFLVLASQAPIRPSAARLEAIYAEPGIAAQMLQAGLPQATDWLSTWRMNERGVRDYVGSAPLHRDDRTFLEYRGPWRLGELSSMRQVLSHFGAAAGDPASWVDFSGFSPEKQAQWTKAIRQRAMAQGKI